MAGDPTPDIFIGSDTKVEYREERISIGHGDYVSKYRPAEILQIAARWTEHARSLGWKLRTPDGAEIDFEDLTTRMGAVIAGVEDGTDG